MKKANRLIALILAMMMTIPYTFAVNAEGMESFDAQGNAAVTEETAAEDTDEAKPEETAETEKVDEEASPAEGPASGDAADSEQAEAPAEEVPEADPTKVTVAKSIDDLAKKSEAATDNEAFFTIDASKKKAPATLATDEIQQDVKDILKSGDSASSKQTEIAETLQDSGYYSTEESGKSEVDVTSRFAYQRLRLIAEKEKEINAYGATQAVYFDGYYFLSYDSMEATKQAYDALSEEYGDKAVMVDRPVKLQVNSDWGEVYMALDTRRAEINALPEGQKKKVKVAVVDTGINPDHEIFDGRDVVGSYNYIRRGYYPTDDNGHGTAVAGIIAQSTPSNVQIMVYKALDSRGEGSLLNVFNAVQSANTAGADIINLSLGALLDENDPEDMKDYAAMQYYDSLIGSLGALVISASGNEYSDFDTHYYEVPGEFDSTVCVGAIDVNENRASFSNYGNKLDFVAPGKNNSIAVHTNNYGTKSGSGTSFATPYICGAAACLKSVNYSHDKQEIVEDLKAISKDLGTPGKDREYGNGCPRFTESSSIDTEERNLAETSALHVSINNATYTGSAQEPEVTVKLFWETLVEDRDYTLEYSDNINAGKGKVTITGTGNEEAGYYGSITKTFTIDPKQVTPAFDLSGSSFNYTGGGIAPGMSGVKAGGTNLVSGKDYTVSYSNNVYPGRGTVTVTCKGNYRGSASRGFDITSHIANAAASAGDATYTGGAVYPGVGVSLGGRSLGSGSDYHVSYSNNVYIGTGYATITGSGYYYGSVTVPFQIGPKGTTCKKVAKGKKAVTVKWSKQKSKMPKSRITGYQVQVSSDPNFGYDVRTYNVKGYSKTSKKVGKLAKKRVYYARVRTYIKSGGAYYFSNWSNVRSGKTK